MFQVNIYFVTLEVKKMNRVTQVEAEDHTQIPADTDI